MAKESKLKTSKPGTKKKKRARPGRDSKGKFVKRNKAAERWTQATVLPILMAMWQTLTTDENGEPPENKNIVRANDIKLLGEVCLMHSVSKQRWNEWEDKFAEKTKDGLINPRFSESVTDLIKNIKWLLECRLNYSASTMDIFILKNHYEYKDQSHIDNTTRGESMNNPFYELLKQTSQSSSPKK